MALREDNKIDHYAFIERSATRKILSGEKSNIALYSGVGNKSSREIKAQYQASETEKIIDGPTNSMIILGKDRTAGLTSGYGGKGFSGCAAIDIIAGFMGPRPVSKTEYGSPIASNKDFKNDSSRIYLSQMTDIDDNFGLPEIRLNIGNIPIPLEQTKATAGIGIKSDNIRVIARESIRIVTLHGGQNALSKRTTDSGIDIIAGINAAATGTDPFLELQPMVKGNNLIECLQFLIKRVENVEAELSTFIETQRKINGIMVNHSHISNKAAAMTSGVVGPNGVFENFKVLIDTIADVINNIKATSSFDGGYFNSANPKYILSRFNRVN